jgi:hypothetical protein
MEFNFLSKLLLEPLHKKYSPFHEKINHQAWIIIYFKFKTNRL